MLPVRLFFNANFLRHSAKVPESTGTVPQNRFFRDCFSTGLPVPLAGPSLPKRFSGGSACPLEPFSESAEHFEEVLARYDIELTDDTEEARQAEDAAKAVHTHGGAREGAGRKPTGHITRTIRVLPEQYELLRSLGGSDFLRVLLDRIREGKVAVPVDTSKFTEEEQDRFIDGWTDAGGNTDDGEAESPWFAPWEWSPEIIVHGTTPEEWGADFYKQCKPEIDALLAADEGE